MLIEFLLSMPNAASWNGKWSGEGRYYSVVKPVPKAKALELLKKDSYYYGWDDGWGASVSVEHVDSRQAQKARRKSVGFCGYEWMVKSIIEYGEIKARREWLVDSVVAEKIYK